ncbi:hypothetical protein Tcan_00524, partial [Toxocara canis]
MHAACSTLRRPFTRPACFYRNCIGSAEALSSTSPLMAASSTATTNHCARMSNFRKGIVNNSFIHSIISTPYRTLSADRKQRMDICLGKQLHQSKQILWSYHLHPNKF